MKVVDKARGQNKLCKRGSQGKILRGVDPSKFIGERKRKTEPRGSPLMAAQPGQAGTELRCIGKRDPRKKVWGVAGEMKKKTTKRSFPKRKSGGVVTCQKEKKKKKQNFLGGMRRAILKQMQKNKKNHGPGRLQALLNEKGKRRWRLGGIRRGQNSPVDAPAP